MNTLFLTGGSGFVGSHVAARFLADGWRVRALVRRPDRPGLLPTGATPVSGALDDGSTWRAPLAEVDAVIHCAGLVKARNLAAYCRVNVDGTRTVVEAANAACPSAMFVHVSSQAAAGPARNGQPVREMDVPRPVSSYGQSKLLAEAVVREKRCGPWCIVRPSVVYGPGDRGLLEMFSIVSAGIAPILAGGRCRVQMLAGEDLARILSAAARRPDLAGRVGFAAGDTVSTGDLMRFLASLRRPQARLIPVPALAVRLAGVVESVRQAVLGQTLPFNQDKAREILQSDWLCDGGPLLRDLGVQNLKPWQQGVVETCRWYLQQRRLPACFAIA